MVYFTKYQQPMKIIREKSEKEEKQLNAWVSLASWVWFSDPQFTCYYCPAQMATNHGMINQLRASLVQLYCLLSTLNSAQVNKIHQVEKCFMTAEDGKCNHILSKANKTHLPSIIENCSMQELASLVNMSQNSSGSMLACSGLENIDNYQAGAFSSLFRILLLQETLFASLNSEDIVSLKNIIPTCSPDQLLKLFQQLQVLMIGTHLDTVQEYHKTLQDSALCKQNFFYELLGCQQDGTIIQQILCDLYSLPLSQVIRFYSVFPYLQGVQLVQLVKLMQLNIIEILDTRKLLAPQHFADNCKDVEMGDSDKDEYCDGDNNNSELSLELLERFPDQAVYKRNLRPYPTVLIKGSGKKFSNKELFRVVPHIYRCDTLEEIPNSLVGDHSQTATIGSILKFKKLKIQLTSRQVNDTFFCVRFELYRQSTASNSSSSPLAVAQSTPIQIVSHSSLIIKSSQDADPICLNEIIPANGTTSGNTRVALLGQNFPDPAFVKVTFDGIEIPCETYGANTIICYSPAHVQGNVSVAVHDSRQPTSHSTNNSKPFQYSLTNQEAFTFSGYDCSSLSFPDNSMMLDELCSPEFDFLTKGHNIT